jgi:hypothetical protein
VPVDDEAAEFYQSLNDGDTVEVKAVRERRRTKTQNNCVHGWLRQLSKDLNAAGLTPRVMLPEEVELEWDEEDVVMAKKYIWKPIQLALADKESTADASTTDFPAVYEVIVRHLAQKYGFTAPPWPDRFNGGGQRAA